MPISYGEIQAWSNLTNIILLPEEVALLTRMDNRFLEISYQENQATIMRAQERAKARANGRRRK